MNANKIREGLKNKKDVEQYIAYLSKLLNEKKKGVIKNPWMAHRTEQFLVNIYLEVEKTGIPFDGRHVTLQKTGVSYDYIAYKNRMLLTYPEALFDAQLVKEGDSFSFSKSSGRVDYQHDIKNPFGNPEIVGGYCVIKIKRGEFITFLSSQDINKHRLVAKTDFIWSNWFEEMCLKTIIKKACKIHFEDIYSDIEALDNEQYDLEQPLTLPLETKQAIEAIKSMDELKAYYSAHKDTHSGVLEDFTMACTNRKQQLIKDQTQKEEELQEDIKEEPKDSDFGESNGDN